MNPKEQLHLLIVDDEDPFRMILCDVLSSLGNYTIKDCDTGEGAVKLMSEETFDVVVLDYKMADMSGLNVLQWMHEQKITTPVLMLTAAGSETVAVEAMKLGAYDYVRKEHVDVDHLPIIINGIYERFLFRNEKMTRQVNEGMEAKWIALKTYQNTITQLSLNIKNALSIMSLSLQEYEEDLEPFVTKQGRQKFADAFTDLRHIYDIIGSGVHSVIDLAEMFYDKTGAELHPEEELKKTEAPAEKAEPVKAPVVNS